jgi:cytochrome c oxidase cbb3-type subunit 3
MADFFSEFWSDYITSITLVGIIACAVLLWVLSHAPKQTAISPETTGHAWDEDLCEYNNPLPRWWMWLFYITIIFSLAYLVFYPGLGSYRGSLDWTTTQQYAEEMDEAKAQFAPLFDKYLAQDIRQLAADPQAHEMGERLFLNTCAQCHGSDAHGSKGFPNLTDKDWLGAGPNDDLPSHIERTILEGRHGVMPPMAAAVGNESDVRDVANYVLSLSGSAHDKARSAAGKTKFAACAACHGEDGKGNTAIGAPNLTDKIWLYGGSVDTIMETINKGRDNQMPPFKDRLGEGKAHVIAAYVWSLSR